MQINNKNFRPEPGVRGRSILIDACWQITSLLTLRNPLCVWSGVKRAVLTGFGAKIGRGVVIKPSVHVKYPWKLEIGDDSWIGERVWIDNIVSVKIGSDVCISQGAYIGNGNHDWTDPAFRLTASPIRLEKGCWICARSIVASGVTVGEGAVLAIGSVATGHLEAWTIYAGNPAQAVRPRKMSA